MVFQWWAAQTYRAQSLVKVYPEYTCNPANEGEVVIAAKAFNTADCLRYLDRNVLKKGYQPVQITIQNNRTRPIIFYENAISLPCASVSEIAPLVHTSTFGRVAIYSVGGLFVWPLFIPAICDGIRSSEANHSLNHDFWAKSLQEQVINPHTCITGLVFIPRDYFQPIFCIDLWDAESQEKIQLTVDVQCSLRSHQLQCC